MKTLPRRLLDYLDQNEVRYETLHYPLDFTAQEKAADTHTPGIGVANPALRPLRGLAQDVTLLRKNAKAKGSAFAQSRKSEEAKRRREEEKKRRRERSGQGLLCDAWLWLAQAYVFWIEV